MQLKGFGRTRQLGVDPKKWPPAAIILMLSGISRYLRTEEAFDVDIGHAETIAVVEHHVHARRCARAPSQHKRRSK